MLDGGALFKLGPVDLDYVEAARVFQQSVRLEEGQGSASEPCLTVGVDSFGGAIVGRVATGLHFDKDDSLAIDGQDVELAIARAMAGEALQSAYRNRICEMDQKIHPVS